MYGTYSLGVTKWKVMCEYWRLDVQIDVVSDRLGAGRSTGLLWSLNTNKSIRQHWFNNTRIHNGSQAAIRGSSFNILYLAYSNHNRKDLSQLQV